MVEQNDKNEEGTKRRGRLFGGRRARSGMPDEPDALDASGTTASADVDDAESMDAGPITDSVPVQIDTRANPTTTPEAVGPVTGEVPVVPAAVVEPPAAEAAAAVPAAEAAVGQPEPAAVPAPERAAEPAAVPEPEPEAERAAEPYVPVATSTTSLIFHAPVLPVLPDRPARYERHDSPVSPFEDEEPGDQPTGRRRSRRRGGASQEDAGDTGAQQQQRQPRERQRREPELITEPQKIKGSTRLEAKKQRRRDGRDAGRRRTVITEFLARRESVDRQMIVRSQADRIEIGVLEDGVLAEHYVTKNHNVSLIGNVYLGKVQNVLPSMEAAFVDIGRGRNAVLYSGEVDWDSVEKGNQPRRIELALKPGDKVLVQVTKDPVGHKGARLTSQISLPGRYLVYVPNGSMNGISRKLPDTERARLKKILKEVLPERAGVIVRTAAEGATEDQLTRDVKRLTNQWDAIQKKIENGQAPVLLHSEPDLLVKIVRDVFNEDFTKLIIDGEAAHAVIDEYLTAVAPDLKDRVETYEGPDSFEEHRLNEQIEKALDRKVWLPSGGSLVIDRTEAMTVVDVNTGKFVGSGGNLEETVTKNNLEAAEEIVRQLRLRDIGGIIVVDFIDMVLESNRDLVLRRLMECLSRDRTKHQVAEVTSLGLVQMTRKKIGVGLQESFAEVSAAVNDNTGESSPKGGRSGRKNRGGSGTGGGNGNGGGTAQQPAHAHQITDDVKNALSRIAASTIVQEEPAGAAPADMGPAATAPEIIGAPVEAGVLPVSGDAAPGTPETPGTAATTEPERAPRRSRRSGRGARQAEAAAEVVVSAEEEQEQAPASRRVSTSVAPADTTVAILDIPVATMTRAPRVVSTEAVESILDSVLQALPEPKQPGQGRSRSRRVSSGSISAPAAGTDGDTASGNGADGPVILGQ